MELLLSELSSDATPFLSGEITFFENISISKDDVFNELIRPSEVFDEPTKQCLEIMFGCFSIITKRMLHDHLEGGKYDNPSPQLVEETKNVMKTNTLSERNFGMLDRLMREKPNANLITFEAIIMCQTNKTSSWRNNLTPERRSTLMKWARESTKKQCADFKVRRAEMRAKQNEARLNKIEMKRNREMRAVLLKQNLITAVGKYGGLWSSEEMVDTKLTKFESLAMKREALKCQIQFRQKILPPCNINKKLFQLSEKGKNKSIEMLTRNLKTLITEIIKSTAIVVETERVDICDIVIPKNKLDSEKERLKLLLASECNKLKKKDIVSNGPSKAKKKKSNNVELEKTDSDCIPIVTCIDELIGKKVKHLTVDYDGQEKWFSGIVVCVKPDTTTELVIRYDCEKSKLYSFDYSEFTDSLVKAEPLNRTDLVGKRIRHRFLTDDGSDTWWETGVVICVENKVENPMFTVNYFDFNVENEEIDNYSSSYDVCVYPLFDDYLNHDIQFI